MIYAYMYMIVYVYIYIDIYYIYIYTHKHVHITNFSFDDLQNDHKVWYISRVPQPAACLAVSPPNRCKDIASNPLTLSACADCRCRTSSCRTEQDKDTSGLYWWVGVWFVEFAFAVQQMQIRRCYLKKEIYIYFGEDSRTFFWLTQITSFSNRHGPQNPQFHLSLSLSLESARV